MEEKRAKSTAALLDRFVQRAGATTCSAAAFAISRHERCTQKMKIACTNLESEKKKEGESQKKNWLLFRFFFLEKK